MLSDTTVTVRFLVKDLPLFKNETFGLGPHLHVLLDNHSYQAVYDASQPLVFDNLEPGTHTIRAFASRPWHESFKNEGAFAQTTFHVLTKTQDNNPGAELPLLTYSQPQGTYGAEPILLDFYLTNAPLHLVAQADEADDIADWRIRCTVNGDSFVIDRWQPLYLKGFKPGKNWVQLEYLDDKGNPIQNVFNNTVRLVKYQPNGDDTLSKLVRGELAVAEVRGIVDPDYVPPAPELSPEPSPEPSLESNPEPDPESIPELSSEPSPEANPVPAEEPTLEPTPSPTLEAAPKALPESPSRLEPSAPALETPERERSDRAKVMAPPAVILPAPSLTPTPEATSEPSTQEPSSSASETVAPSEPGAPEAEPLQPKMPVGIEAQPTGTNEPVAPGTPLSSDSKALSGQARLRQLRRQLGNYLPQQGKAIAPSSTPMPKADRRQSTPLPDDGSSPIPGVSIPEPLPPTLPEITDTDQPEPMIPEP